MTDNPQDAQPKEAEYYVKDGWVNVRRNGEVEAVPLGDLQSALAKGWEPETTEARRRRLVDQKYGSSDIQAGLSGAARGLSFGLSDVALTKSGLVEKNTLAGLKEANPVSSTVGEIAGIAGGMALSGGLGTVGTVGRVARGASSAVRGAARLGTAAEQLTVRALGGATGGIARQIAVKGAGAAAQGATEGALYGAGQLVTEEALGHTELTAERILAHMGASTVLGGALGGAMGAGVAAAKPAGQAALASVLGLQSATREAAAGAATATREAGESVVNAINRFEPSESIRDGLKKFARQRAIKATGGRGSDIRKMGKTAEEIEDIGQELLDMKLRDGRRVIESRDDGDAIYQKLKVAKKEAGEDLGAFRDEIDQFVEDNRKAGVARVAEGSEPPATIAEVTEDLAPDVGEYLSRVRKEVLEPLNNSMLPAQRKKAKKVFQELGLLQEGYEKGYKFTLSELQRFRQELRKVIQPPKPKGAGLPSPPSAHAAELESAERILENYIEEVTEKAATELGRVNEYGKLKTKYKAATRAAAVTEKAQSMDLANRWLSPSDYLSGAAGAVTGAATMGPIGVVGAGATALANKWMREKGSSTLARAAEKIAGIRALDNMQSSVATRINQAANAFAAGDGLRAIGGTTQAAAPSRGIIGTAAGYAGAKLSAQEVFSQQVEAIEQFTSRPDMLIDQVAARTAGASTIAPKVAAAMQHKAASVVRYLNESRPRPPAIYARTILPGKTANAWKPTDEQANQFNRRVRAAIYPMTALDDMTEGKLAPEAVEAVKALYPALYEEIATSLLEAVQAREAPVDYGDKVQLSILFGVPLDPSLTPEYIAGMQDKTGPGQQGQGKGKGPNGLRLAGLNKLEFDKDSETASGRLAGA